MLQLRTPSPQAGDDKERDGDDKERDGDDKERHGDDRESDEVMKENDEVIEARREFQAGPAEAGGVGSGSSLGFESFSAGDAQRNETAIQPRGYLKDG